jgi:hypothetical protein
VFLGGEYGNIKKKTEWEKLPGVFCGGGSGRGGQIFFVCAKITIF